MGNRAVITTYDSLENNGVGVYLHWNGGWDSVEAFLTYCKLQGYRPPEIDSYGWARLCQVIGNFFGGPLSVGIDRVDRLDQDNGDNGVYIIDNWKIIGRLYNNGREQKEYSLLQMLDSINEKMPKELQLTAEYILEHYKE